MGNYYNFYAATAGSGTSTFVGEAPDSICGEGWRMVGNEGEIDGKEEKSWINLFSKYYGEEKNGNELVNGDTIVLASSFNFLRSGDYRWNYGDLHNRSVGSNYWSSKAHAEIFARNLGFVPTSLHYQASDAKGFGFPLRCVARFPKKNEAHRKVPRKTQYGKTNPLLIEHGSISLDYFP